MVAAAARIAESQNAAVAAQEEGERLRTRLSEATKEQAKLAEALRDKDKVTSKSCGS